MSRNSSGTPLPSVFRLPSVALRLTAIDDAGVVAEHAGEIRHAGALVGQRVRPERAPCRRPAHAAAAARPVVERGPSRSKPRLGAKLFLSVLNACVPFE